MTARLRVTHEIRCNYDAPVASSYTEVRATPMTTPDQVALRTRLDVRPAPWTAVHHDYWGSQVSVVEVHEPHEQLTVVATATVEVDRPHVEPPGAAWAVLRSPAVTGAHAELLAVDPLTRLPHDLAARVAGVAAHGGWPDDVALSLCGLLHAEVVQVGSAGRGAGAGQRRAADAWAERSATCHDAAHLALGALRSVGIPARYVSGYLHPEPRAEAGTVVAAEPHAWVEWWTGDWFAWDPTLDVAPGDAHVVVARARTHADVPGFRGVHAGTARAVDTVSVEVTRLA